MRKIFVISAFLVAALIAAAPALAEGSAAEALADDGMRNMNESLSLPGDYTAAGWDTCTVPCAAGGLVVGTAVGSVQFTVGAGEAAASVPAAVLEGVIDIFK